MGLGVKNPSLAISVGTENDLFGSGLLGEDNPDKLLCTIIYMVGLHCVLYGGVEHTRLRRPGCNSQFSFEKDDRGVEHLVFREDKLQKTNQGGLISHNDNKVVYVYAASNPERCPLRLFKKYCDLLPETRKCSSLYLRAKKNVSPRVWYCDQLSCVSFTSLPVI